VDFARIGSPITDSVLALIGLEDDIRGLSKNPRHILELPAVAMAVEDGDAKRLNFSILWQQGLNSILVLVYRVGSQTDLEVELSRQIRARLMAEAEATARAKELARANSDLESFASIISHDLKAPMRHMRRLAQQLVEENGANPALNAKLSEISNQARRMSDMLSALLDYSTLGRKYEGVEEVDTRAMIEAIAQSFPKSGISLRISGDWPRLATLSAPLDLVLRNLIDNALKHHDRADGTISISSLVKPQSLEISVADDGPGIATKDQAAAFLPFRALNQATDGTGMGLAMVKKTIEGAGGTIALYSDPPRARGTKFTISWPKFILT
jgi:signal transduction histidine kinase